MLPAATPRVGCRQVALLAVASILFQAILFGWHHHPLPFDGHGRAAILANSTSSTPQADDEDGCEICQALHHLSSASTESFFAFDPPPAPAAPAPRDTVFVAEIPALPFHARAPPLA
ncbi:MAG TPA: hypothetical protein VHW66_06040 [Stellaceae bacterium]|jgi:hypothetical protein|nr:hypothetical protein [Stellaceae bacterium]